MPRTLLFTDITIHAKASSMRVILNLYLDRSVQASQKSGLRQGSKDIVSDTG